MSVTQLRQDVHPYVLAAQLEDRMTRAVFIPVNPKNKRPLINAWQKRTTNDFGEIQSWFRKWPNALLGVTSGAASGVWFLDVDGSKGAENLAKLEKDNGKLPMTPRFKTPGGRRIAFKVPKGVWIRTIAKDLDDGLDVRGCQADGSASGQTIFPPSVRADGGKYEWEAPYVGLMGAADAPAWLLFLVAFNRREREQLAAIGITGPGGFNGAPPAEWQSIAAEKLRPTRDKAFVELRKAVGDAAADKVRNYVKVGIEKQLAELGETEEGEREKQTNISGLKIHGLLLGAREVAVNVADIAEWAEGAYRETVDSLNADLDADDYWQRTGDAAKPRDLQRVLPEDPTKVFEPIGDQPGGPRPDDKAKPEAGEQQQKLLKYPHEISLQDQLELAAKAIVRGLLHPGDSAVVYGEPGAGKTFFVLFLCWLVAMGHKFYDRLVRKVPILYVCLEGVAGFDRRTLAAREGYGDTGKFFARLNVPISLVKGTAGKEGAEIIIKAARQLCADAGEASLIIVVDTMSRAMAGDNENDTGDMMSFVEHRIGHIQRQTGAAVLVCHHPNRQGEMRGNSSLRGSFDVVGCISIVGNQRILTMEKVKDGETGDKFIFGLSVVELGRNFDGTPLTSCIVAPGAVEKANPDEPKSKKQPRKPMSPRERTFCDVFGKLETAGKGDRADLPTTGEHGYRIDMPVMRDAFFDAYVTGGKDAKDVDATKRAAWSRILREPPPGFESYSVAGAEYVWRSDTPFAANAEGYEDVEEAVKEAKKAAEEAKASAKKE